MIPILFAWAYGLVLYLLAWFCKVPALAVVGYVFSAWMFLSGTIQAWRYTRGND